MLTDNQQKADIITSICFKQKITYANGSKTPYTYIRFKSDGNITLVSGARNTISSPSSLVIQKGFEIISEKEFNSIINKIYKGI